MKGAWIASLVVAALFAVAARGGERHPTTTTTTTKVRAAWEWSTEERIAARFDAEAIRSRARAEGLDGAFVDAGPGTVVVDGAKNPELLLPGELFGALFPANAAAMPEVKQRYEQSIRALGWEPAEFWRDAERITAEYIAIRAANLRTEVALANASRAEIDAASRDLMAAYIKACRARIAAIAALREHFGPSFDRLLYESVAPNLVIASGSTAADAAQMLRAERECR